MLKKIGFLVGSLRKESFSRKIFNAIADMLPKDYEALFIDISNLNIYNQDLDENPPESWQDFREIIKSLDNFIFITPEYNRSVPAVLKNALDVGSRPPEAGLWNKKPAGVVSVSPGVYGGFGANHHLRQTLSFLNMPTLGQPEIYLSNVHNYLDESGKINNDKTKVFLQNFVDSYIKWINIF